MVRRVPSKHRNTSVIRAREQGALMRLILLLACGLALATGFVYAGGEHFAALRLGYQTEKLRSELESTRDHQRTLLVQREIVASPARLELAARQLGMQPMQAAQIDPLRRSRSGTEPQATPPVKQVARNEKELRSLSRKEGGRAELTRPDPQAIKRTPLR